LRRIIGESLGPRRRFEELSLPAHVVAATLEGGRETWFSTGRIEGPLLATSAMPGVFPPVTIDGVQYVDGGIVNNVPVMKAVEEGARKVYVLNVSGVIHPRELHRPHDFMMHGLVLSRAHRYHNDLARAAESAEIIEMPRVEVNQVAFTNLAMTQELIQAGYETGLRFLRGEIGRPQPEAPQEASAV
jgi:NTE family protein